MSNVDKQKNWDENLSQKLQ